MNQPVIIEKSKLFNNEMKITEGHIPWCWAEKLRNSDN
jgi:hypothetical protein